MKIVQLLQLSIVALCLVHSTKCDDDTLIGAFNDIYATCLVHLNTDCVQPKALEWLSKAIQKREIHLTNDLSIMKNESIVLNEEATDGESARNHHVNILSKVDEFLATHYLNIRYPKAIINENVPSFMVSTLNRFIPDSMHVPLEEGNVNEGTLFLKKQIKSIFFFFNKNFFSFRSWTR